MPVSPQLLARLRSVAGVAAKPAAGAAAGLGVSAFEQSQMNQGLDAVGAEPVGPFGRAASYGVNGVMGALTGITKYRPSARTLLASQVFQPALMAGDRFPRFMSHMSDAAIKLSDTANEIHRQVVGLPPKTIVSANGNTTTLPGTPSVFNSVRDLVDQSRKIVADPGTKTQVQNAIASGAAMMDSGKRMAATVGSAADKVNDLLPGSQTVSDLGNSVADAFKAPEVKHLVEAGAKAIDPRWAIGTSLAVGAPWLGWELHKRNQAKAQAAAKEQQQTRMLAALERIAQQKGAAPLAPPLASAPANDALGTLNNVSDALEHASRGVQVASRVLPEVAAGGGLLGRLAGAAPAVGRFAGAANGVISLAAGASELGRAAHDGTLAPQLAASAGLNRPAAGGLLPFYRAFSYNQMHPVATLASLPAAAAGAIRTNVEAAIPTPVAAAAPALLAHARHPLGSSGLLGRPLPRTLPPGAPVPNVDRGGIRPAAML